MSVNLTIVGVGIKFFAHLTKEAEAYIRESTKLLYLVNEPASKEWLKRNNSSAESLDEIYQKFPQRKLNYIAITEYIIKCVEKFNDVCVVLYGHPCVFATPALEAVKQIKNNGGDAVILPGISAEDCLFADLLIDPGTSGCQSFEATDFLLYQRKFDTSSHLILWQIGVVGTLGLTNDFNNQLYLDVMTEYLKKFYPSKHQVTLYQAAQLPGLLPEIQTCEIEQLSALELTPLSTLYVPPSILKQYDIQSFNTFGFD
jgi:uncharacterized protein YabN with tetrapyrrole methylase and pyrophosphatase domain